LNVVVENEYFREGDIELLFGKHCSNCSGCVYCYDEEIKRVNEIADKYNVEISNKIIKPHVEIPFRSSYAQYTITLDSIEQRERLIKLLFAKEIPTNVFYPIALSDQKVFSKDIHLRRTKISAFLAERVLSIPIHPYLVSDEVDFIISAINEILEV
jgi:dTDP-4-amino-4,6-dideoxygalactose transaminase